MVLPAIELTRAGMIELAGRTVAARTNVLGDVIVRSRPPPSPGSEIAEDVIDVIGADRLASGLVDRAAAIRLPVTPDDRSRVDAHRKSIAIADATRLQVLKLDGTERCEAEYDNAENAYCLFTADGKGVWHLCRRGDDIGLELRDAGTGRRVVARAIEVANAEGASWWLERPHPTLPVIPVSAGMGEEGSICTIAAATKDALALTREARDVGFAGWSPSGKVYATLGHHDDRLVLHRYPDHGEIATIDLAPVLGELGDGHQWEVLFADDDRFVVPTSEGRLLWFPDRATPTELRLAGDTRVWDWAVVALAGTYLVTIRHRDAAAAVWDAAHVLATS
jgi:hypothetical protein